LPANKGDLVKRTRLFKSNQSQAVRLPKPVAFPDSIKAVEIVTIGRSRLITPAGGAWDDWFAVGGVTKDYMADRDQPADQERES
jgi:antitoxin VapB